MLLSHVLILQLSSLADVSVAADIMLGPPTLDGGVMDVKLQVVLRDWHVCVYFDLKKDTRRQSP